MRRDSLHHIKITACIPEEGYLCSTSAGHDEVDCHCSIFYEPFMAGGNNRRSVLANGDSVVSVSLGDCFRFIHKELLFGTHFSTTTENNLHLVQRDVNNFF